MAIFRTKCKHLVFNSYFLSNKPMKQVGSSLLQKTFHKGFQDNWTTKVFLWDLDLEMYQDHQSIHSTHTQNTPNVLSLKLYNVQLW